MKEAAGSSSPSSAVIRNSSSWRFDPTRSQAWDRLRVQAEPVLGDRVADSGPSWSAHDAGRAAAHGVAEPARSDCALPPWPGTWPGRRRSAPPRGPSGCSDPYIEMPTLIVTGSASGAGRALSATCARRSLAELQSRPRDRSAGISTASPRRRAGRRCRLVRTRSRMIRAISRIRLSPAWLPRLSLTALSPSMSTMIRAPWPP